MLYPALENPPTRTMPGHIVNKSTFDISSGLLAHAALPAWRKDYITCKDPAG